MNERVIFGHNPLDQSSLKLFSWKSNQIISVKIKPKYPWLSMLKVHNRGVGNSTPQRSFRIHNFNGAILLNVELSCLSFKRCATTHTPKNYALRNLKTVFALQKPLIALRELRFSLRKLVKINIFNSQNSQIFYVDTTLYASEMTFPL